MEEMSFWTFTDQYNVSMSTAGEHCKMNYTEKRRKRKGLSAYGLEAAVCSDAKKKDQKSIQLDKKSYQIL